MKTSGMLIFYISESEDFELWRALNQYPSDDRARIIKNILKKAVIGNQKTTKQKGYSSRSNLSETTKKHREVIADEILLDDLSDVANESESGIEIDSLDENALELEDFDELTANNNLDEDYLIDTNNKNIEHSSIDFSLDDISISKEDLEQSSPSENLKGLNFLLNNVIGEENDEQLIEFIKSKNDDKPE